MEPNNTKDHNHTEGHCCACEGCGVMCKRDQAMHPYWIRHFLILVFGVIAAFFVGYHLGTIKGYIMSQYNMPMRSQMIR